jgi:hypothetical protein
LELYNNPPKNKTNGFSSEPAVDMAVLAKPLLNLTITSVAFRRLIASLGGTLHTVSRAAAHVHDTAVQVQEGAQDVQSAVEELENVVGLHGIMQSVDDVIDGTTAIIDGLDEGMKLDPKDDERHEEPLEAFVVQVHEVFQSIICNLPLSSNHVQILLEAHQEPSQIEALKIVLLLFQNYAHQLGASIATKAYPTAQTPGKVRILTERAASGRSLEPILTRLDHITNYIAHAPMDSGFRAYFLDLNAWLDTSLSSSVYARSQRSKQTLASLCTRASNLLNAPAHSQLRTDLHDLLDDIEAYSSALVHNRAIGHLASALSSLSASLAALTRDAATSREEILRDLFGWLMPKVVKVLTPLPMPRFEYVDTALGVAAAIDTIWLRLGAVGDLTPDVVNVRNWADVSIDMQQSPLAPPNIISTTRASISARGIRASIKDVGYVVHLACFGLGWLGEYMDEGLLDVDLGNGVNVDLQLELRTDEAKANAFDFTLADVRVTIPTLSITLKRTRHWILNTLLIEPFGRTVGRIVLQSVARNAVENVVGKVRDVLGIVTARGAGTAGTPMGHMDVWWKAIVEVFGRKDVKDGSTGLESTATATTHATPKGVVYTTNQKPLIGSEAGDAPAEQTIFAVGLVPQVVEGGPDLVRPEDRLGQALDDARETVDKASATAAGTMKGKTRALHLREELDHLDERMEDRRATESESSGWRSAAFDL